MSSTIIKRDGTTESQMQNRGCPQREERNQSPLSSLHSCLARAYCDNRSALPELHDTHRGRQLSPTQRKRDCPLPSPITARVPTLRPHPSPRAPAACTSLPCCTHGPDTRSSRWHSGAGPQSGLPWPPVSISLMSSNLANLMSGEVFVHSVTVYLYDKHSHFLRSNPRYSESMWMRQETLLQLSLSARLLSPGSPSWGI